MGEWELLMRYRLMSQAMGKLAAENRDTVNAARADGRCVCDHCGLDYFRHPEIDENCPTLVIVCDGRILKL